MRKVKAGCARCRHNAVAVCFGGDEFTTFLRTDAYESAQIAERIREVVVTRDWSAIADGLRVALSMGLTACVDGVTGRELYDHANR